MKGRVFNMAQNFSDKDRMTDALNSQKYVTEHYNSFACEAATPEVVSCIMQILNEEHTIQQDVFKEMSSRGWYVTEAAEDTKLQKAKSEYQAFTASQG